MKKLLILVLAIIIASPLLKSQIGIYPQAIFLDMQNRSSNLKVLNNSSETKEIVVDMKFGFPGYDVNGKSFMYYGDTLAEAKQSAIPFVKVFPKKLLLKPKEEQVLRFMIGNVGDAPDGTYYCRIFVTSKNPPEEIDSTYKETITAKVDLQFTLIAALIFRKGKSECEIKVNNPKFTKDSAGTYILFDFEKTGNSPFFGTLDFKLTDMNGNDALDKKEVTPIYQNSTKAFKIDEKALVSGKYKLELNMTNEHKDVPDDFKIPFKPLNATFEVDYQK